ncbi:hypothetical protein NQ318_008581 [Aromia moschata]|uniref:Uncharacterized protein n=1 Tax=Aromia moschata TaxID=1265417 RepID=A0AAV8YVZ6_9CUCU|nr:hypothetical protein NQ318_008581 [Aromia moschata]
MDNAFIGVCRILIHNSSNFVTVRDKSVMEISMLHMDALGKLKRSAPHLEFPALHKELFSVDS